jgi:hypothetical protein
MQFNLFSTKHETFILVSTTALLLALALPTIVFVPRELAPSLRGYLHQYCPVVSGAVGALTGLFIVGLYAEAIALKWWEVGAPPETMSVIKPTCRADGEGNAEVRAVVENRTKKRFILSADDAIHAFFDGEQVKQSSLKTSLGSDGPFLIINDGTVFWVWWRGKTDAKASPKECIVRLVRNGSIVSDIQPTYWWAPLE